MAPEVLERTIGNRHHLRVSTVLNRVVDENGCRIGPERPGLMFRTVDEFDGGNVHPRNAAGFQINDVVHTARRTTPSISEGFDHQVA